MGQYYRPVVKLNGKITIYNRDVDGEYTMAKLTEHSWWCDSLMNAISEKFYQNKGRLIWCGDYAENDEIQMTNLTMQDIWDCEGEGVNSTDFKIDNLYLCNHDLKKYIDLNEYKKISKDSDGWILHPLSLLTAVGNGRGGGDYRGINEDKIGIWAYNELSFENQIPDKYTKFNIMFKEV